VSGRDSSAELSAGLAGLFPPGAVCTELIGKGDPDCLLPAEAQHLGKSVASRREEFAAGRVCAARALREFGIVDFPLRVGEDRRPLWPDAFTGSITHTDGFCAAVVAPQREQRAIGIDTERTERVKPDLWPRICGPEMAFLDRLPESQRPSAATLIFCIKEAFYKCQYTLTREYLGFDDARVEIGGWPCTQGDFAVHACRPMALCQQASLPLVGRYVFHQQFVTAGISVSAGG